MENAPEALSIPWHQLLGTLLSLTLTPVDIQVESEVQVTTEPPKVDVLLLRRNTARWTDEQRALLPDGIRSDNAANHLLEFKYSESISEEALAQAIAYEYFYRTARKLTPRDVRIWLISSKTPRRSRLQEWGYAEADIPGLYQSRQILVRRVGLLVLNQLSPAAHNAFIKIFASRQEEKETAFQQISRVRHLDAETQIFLRGLREVVEVEDKTMTITLTPELVMRRGHELTRALLEMLTPEERLAGLQPEERLAGLQPEERLAGLQPEERLAGLQPEERLAGLQPEERLAGLQPEELITALKSKERVANIEPDDLLSIFSIDEIEAYLERHRAQPEAKKPSVE